MNFNLDQPDDHESSLEMAGDTPFHLAGSIFPDASIKVVSVSPDTPLKDALTLMLENSYSQLPVIDNDKYRGVVSLKSICQCLRDLYFSQSSSSSIRVNLSDMRVSEAMDIDVPSISPSDNIGQILSQLDEYESLVMGSTNKVQAVVTPFDLVKRLWQIAGPYILAQEIELALRQIIHKTLPPTPEYEEIILRPFRNQDDKEHLKKVEDMDLSELTSVITTNVNWPYFSQVFGNKALFTARIKLITQLRNKIMHHTGELSGTEYDQLSNFRNQLLDKLNTLSQESVD